MVMCRILELEDPWKLSSLTMGKPVTIQMTSGVYKNVDSHPEPLNQCSEHRVSRQEHWLISQMKRF